MSDDEKAARERLGLWLSAEQNRTWTADLDVTGRVTTVKLYYAVALYYYTMASAMVGKKTIEGSGPTLAAAILDALQKVSE